MLAAGSAHATTTSLSGMQSRPVADGAYTVQNNEWGSSASESITTNGNARLHRDELLDQQRDQRRSRRLSVDLRGLPLGQLHPGGLGAHPVQVTRLTVPGTVTTSWKTRQPGGSAAYDVAYDLWFNRTPAATGQPDGAELMVWLNHHGPVQPFGSQVGTATIGGVSYQVWEGAQSWGDTISYVMASPATSVRNLDVGALAADAVRRGYIRTSWYLIDVEAGFELWRGGAGLATDFFSVNLGGSHRNPASASMPAPGPPSATSPASAFDISRQAISPDPAIPKVTTNATVDVTNAGPAMASDVTVVIEVLNAAGTVVGSRSWAGQNVAPHQVLNETYAWTASTAGTYTIEALMRASSGKILEQAQVGTLTVKLVVADMGQR